MTKICYTCKTEKPKAAFHRHGQKADGLDPSCKDCARTKRHAAERALPSHVKEEKAARKKRYDAKYNAENRAKKAAQSRDYYEKNKEHYKQTVKKWAEKNPDKVKSIKQSYKHRRRTIEKAGMTGKELHTWMAAQENTCFWCGIDCEDEPIVDHYFPLSKGGKHEAENLVIACRPCNARKAAKLPADFAKEIGKMLK